MDRIARLARHLQGGPASAPSADDVAGGSRIGIGIIGAGDIAAQSFAPALLGSEVTELVAVSRRNASQAAAFAEEHGGGCASYDSNEALLADPAVDAVIIATPTHTHCELTVLAAQHGKHVLVEKIDLLLTAV